MATVGDMRAAAAARQMSSRREANKVVEEDSFRRLAVSVQKFDAQQIKDAAVATRELSQEDKLALQMRESDRDRAKQMLVGFGQAAMGRTMNAESFAYLGGMLLMMAVQGMQNLDPKYKYDQYRAGHRSKVLDKNLKFEERQRRVDAGQLPYKGLPIPAKMQMWAFSREKAANDGRLSMEGLRTSLTPETATNFLLGAYYNAYVDTLASGGDLDELNRIKYELKKTTNTIKHIAAKDGISESLLMGDGMDNAFMRLACDEQGNPKVGQANPEYILIGTSPMKYEQLNVFMSMIDGQDFAQEASLSMIMNGGRLQKAKEEIKEDLAAKKGSPEKKDSSEKKNPDEKYADKVNRENAKKTGGNPKAKQQEVEDTWSPERAKYIPGKSTVWKDSPEITGDYDVDVEGYTHSWHAEISADKDKMYADMTPDLPNFLTTYSENDVTTRSGAAVIGAINDIMTGMFYQKGFSDKLGLADGETEPWMLAEMLDSFEQGADRLHEGNTLMPVFTVAQHFVDMGVPENAENAELLDSSLRERILDCMSMHMYSVSCDVAKTEHGGWDMASDQHLGKWVERGKQVSDDFARLRVELEAEGKAFAEAKKHQAAAAASGQGQLFSTEEYERMPDNPSTGGKLTVQEFHCLQEMVKSYIDKFSDSAQQHAEKVRKADAQKDANVNDESLDGPNTSAPSSPRG